MDPREAAFILIRTLLLCYLQMCRDLSLSRLSPSLPCFDQGISKIMFLWTGGRSNSTSADDVILAGDRLMLKNEVGNAQIVIGQLVGPAGKCRSF